MTKLSDVARMAGVSPATASRALNGVSTVDPALARRVLEAATSLDYRPNGVARNLRRRRTDVWALLIADVSNPFFTAVARGVEDIAQANGYSVLLCNTDEDAAKEAQYLAVAELEQVAGVLLSPSAPGCGAARLVRSGIPVVSVDRPSPDAVDAVLVDSRGAAGAAARHLLEEGWGRVACVTGPEGVATAEERLRGYRDAVGAPSADGSLVRRAPFTVEGGRSAAASLLDSDEPPDALLVANSLMALGVLRALADHGLRMGADVGLVAFDDAPWSTLVEPAVTVVAQPAYELGTRAAQLLLERVRGEATDVPARTVVLDARLLVRGSSRRPAGVDARTCQSTSISSTPGADGRDVDVRSR
ncbi:LacI family DNA-binding transcriptional regulator [Pseudokineococcus basanitobsidens]|uniref:LacI family DNA-binding transcriptional regulator n=1 Tax=Pseudokineococcus basanitobsidens TaxID=1926649 RepID=A0ABU8RG22_9ACTN